MTQPVAQANEPAISSGLLPVNSNNQIEGTVVGIEFGPVVSEVRLNTRAGLLTSIVATSSVRRLELTPGSRLIAVIKATELVLARI